MTKNELETLGNLLELILKMERLELTESERLAALKLVNAVDVLSTRRK